MAIAAENATQSRIRGRFGQIKCCGASKKIYIVIQTPMTLILAQMPMTHLSVVMGPVIIGLIVWALIRLRYRNRVPRAQAGQLTSHSETSKK
jgi:hypothetical protein